MQVLVENWQKEVYPIVFDIHLLLSASLHFCINLKYGAYFFLPTIKTGKWCLLLSAKLFYPF